MSWEIDRDTGQLLVDGQRAYAAMRGGVLHCMVRAVDQATFWQQAELVGLVQHQEPGAPAITDPETGEEITPAVPPSGPLRPVRGVTITEIGPYVITPGTYDQDGNEITPPVLDNRWHVNFWLDNILVKLGNWEQFALTWTANGQPVDPMKEEEAIHHAGIELIDPNTVKSPSNMLL